MKLACPNCGKPLRRVKTPWGMVYACLACEGRMVGQAVLRRDRAADRFRHALWQRAREAWGNRRYRQPRGRPCPHCRLPMVEVRMPHELGGVALDVCVRCHSTWFDPSEYGAVPHGPRPAVEPAGARASSPRAREAAAILALERVRRQQADHDAAAGPIEGTGDAWKILPAIFRLPVECSVPALSTRPVVTWSLAAACALAFLATMGGLSDAVRGWGFVPNAWARRGGLTLLTGFFLHGGWMHLVGNLYFLLVFGDNVEDRLGKGKYLLLVLAAHLAGSLVHAALDPRGEVPCIGASGGIFGIVAFYAIAFPRARLAFFFFWPGGWLRVPAWGMLLFYTGLQILGAQAQIAGTSNVSSLAHLGGIAVGVIAAVLSRLGPRRVTIRAPR